MQRKKQSDLWTDQEVRQMLQLMKEDHFAKLVHSTNKTSVEIFEDLSRELSKQQINRTPRQIRQKFNALWFDYEKLQKTQDYNKASQQAKENFDMLEAIFGRKSYNGVTTVEGTKEVKPEAIEIIDDSDEEMADNKTLNDDTTATEQSDEDFHNGIDDGKEVRRKNMRSAEKNYHGYEKVVDSFTKDWKSSQRALIEDLKRQDLRDLRTISKQFKYQETMLKKSRFELEKMLEKDRAELKLLLNSFLKANDAGQTNDAESELKVKEEVEHG